MPSAEAVSLHHFPDGTGHLIRMLGKCPSKENQLRPEHVDDVDDTDPQHLLVLLHNFLQIDIALSCTVENFCRCQFFAGGLFSGSNKSRHRYVCLQASAPPAGTASAVCTDDLVAYFAAAHDAALEDLAVQNDAAADTAAKCEHDNIGIVLAGPRYGLAEGRAVRIVGYSHRAGNDPPENINKIDVLPPQVI